MKAAGKRGASTQQVIPTQTERRPFPASVLVFFPSQGFGQLQTHRRACLHGACFLGSCVSPGGPAWWWSQGCIEPVRVRTNPGHINGAASRGQRRVGPGPSAHSSCWNPANRQVGPPTYRFKRTAEACRTERLMLSGHRQVFQGPVEA